MILLNYSIELRLQNKANNEPRANRKKHEVEVWVYIILKRERKICDSTCALILCYYNHRYRLKRRKKMALSVEAVRNSTTWIVDELTPIPYSQDDRKEIVRNINDLVKERKEGNHEVVFFEYSPIDETYHFRLYGHKELTILKNIFTLRTSKDLYVNSLVIFLIGCKIHAVWKNHYYRWSFS